jgi:cellulose biosynthesis protein BcsQ
LEIEGILITMVDYRTNYAKNITAMLRESYGMNEEIGVLQTFIPFSVKIQRLSLTGSDRIIVDHHQSSYFYENVANCALYNCAQSITVLHISGNNAIGKII